jgi:hypothetical protein
VSDYFLGALQLLDLEIGHGDISPGNICVASEGEDFLTDLGLSMIITQQHWRPASVWLSPNFSFYVTEFHLCFYQGTSLFLSRRLAETTGVLEYQQSDDAESFVWLILWMTMKISPIPSGDPYPNVNQPAELMLFKSNAVSDKFRPTGSFRYSLKTMFEGLVEDAGAGLKGLLLVHVSKRLAMFEKDVVEEFEEFG